MIKLESPPFRLNAGGLVASGVSPAGSCARHTPRILKHVEFAFCNRIKCILNENTLAE